MSGTILIIDDDPNFAKSMARVVQGEGYGAEVAHSGEEALARVAEIQPDLAIVDLGLPGIDGVEVLRRLRLHDPHLLSIALSGTATVQSAVAAMHAGAFDFLTKTSEPEEILFKLRRALEVVDLQRKVQFFADQAHHQHESQMIGESPAISRVFKQIKEIAATPDTTVLILGETGTGKELVARAIHELSERRHRPLVSVNCTAVPASLMESEFFGHERGAFTGASRSKQGLVEVARGGSLLLDEIGDLDPGLQAKLLRLLEQRRFKRVGGVQDLDADVRFIAATNRDLQVMADEGRFRRDLLYRLNVFQLTVPSLRERGRDVMILAQHFIKRFSAQLGREVQGLDYEAEQALCRHSFPGNVRELRNIVEQAVILSQGRWLTPACFPSLVRHPPSPLDTRPNAPALAPSPRQGAMPPPEAHTPPDPDRPLGEQLAKLHAREEELMARESQILRSALEQSQGNKSRAAAMLGISRYALQRRLKRLAL